MERSSSNRETLAWRLATLFHFAALALLLGSVLLPEAWDLFLAILAVLALWFPSAYLMGGGTGRVVRVLAVVAVCLFIATSNRMEQTPRFAEEGTLVVVGLGLSWLVCVLCVPEGMVFSFPLGLLGCVTAALRVHPEGHSHAAWVALATLALTLSGAGMFIDGLKHPGQGRSLFCRTSMWRFSPHLFVGLVAAALMLSTVDFFETKVGWLSAKLPAADGESTVCDLIASPPKSVGRTILTVKSLQGPPPTYLAAKFHVDYQAGVWLRGEPCLGNHHYGAMGTDEQTTTLPRSHIDMVDPRSATPTPFGAFHTEEAMVEVAPKPASERSSGARRATVSWSPEGRQVRVPTPGDHAREAPDLPRLAERARMLCRGVEDDTGKTFAVTNYLRRHFRYDAVTPFAPLGEMDPSEAFLFVTGKGWCIHFATAAALMLRAVDVPTRFVTGYAVPLGETHITVLDRHAHAWCEAYVQTANGPRWVVVDPTIVHVGSEMARSALPRGFVGLALGACALVALLVAFLKTNTRQLRKEAAGDDAKPEPERVVAIFERVVAAMSRRGIYYRRSTTPRQFAAAVVPAEFRADVMIVVQAYERVRYMSCATLGQDGLDRLVAAEDRLLKAHRFWVLHGFL